MNPSIINRLSPETIHKIAAGEVIERPANAVKELVENALDASANKIVIAIEAGGLDLIKVSDNGIGMTSEDAAVAWLPHTTSKIKAAEDLSHIASYGFRGEALCSMAAVAEVTIETRHESETTGTALELSDSKQLGLEEISRNRGTTITVKNLFLHSPVRRKFMGSAKSETTRILNATSRIAMAHPTASFKITDQGRDVLSLSAGTLKHRVGEILGFNITNDLVPVEWTDGKIHIEGYVCTSQQARLRTTHQYFYINRRAIQSGIISRALLQSYEVLPPGRYPMAVLFVTMPTEEVDVNVHPTKKEVRFLNESQIFWSVCQAVKAALRKIMEAPVLDLQSHLYENQPVPSVQESRELFKDTKDAVAPFVYEHANAVGFALAEPSDSEGKANNQIQLFPSENKRYENQFSTFDTEPQNDFQNNSISTLAAKAIAQKVRAPEIPHLQLHQGFILFGVESGLMMVNQQAAHERVLYEKTLDELRQPMRFSSQQLLFPEVLELPASDSLFLEEHLSHFQNLGFDIESFGGNTFQLRGLPVEVKPDQSRVVISEMLQNLMRPERKEGGAKAEDFVQRVAKIYARVTSVKLGQPLDSMQISTLIDNLFATQNPYVSPSGAPIVVRLSMEEIQRKFGLKN